MLINRTRAMPSSSSSSGPVALASDIMTAAVVHATSAKNTRPYLNIRLLPLAQRDAGSHYPDAATAPETCHPELTPAEAVPTVRECGRDPLRRHRES